MIDFKELENLKLEYTIDDLLPQEIQQIDLTNINKINNNLFNAIKVLKILQENLFIIGDGSINLTPIYKKDKDYETIKDFIKEE